jgi:enediyne biosynthesis protein E4
VEWLFALLFSASSTNACVSPTAHQACTSERVQALGANFFVDDHAAFGLTGFEGRRVTLGDVDGDSYPDLIAIKTGTGGKLLQLFLNRPRAGGGRTFVDHTEGSALTRRADGSDGRVTLMAALADVDNDGDLDVFAGSYSTAPFGKEFVADANAVYLNDGHASFTELVRAGVEEPWPLSTSSATFVDYDKDGLLDLFVGNFMVHYPDLESYQDELYRGVGGGRFTRATAQAGLLTVDLPGDREGYYPKPTYGVTSCDLDGDGWPELLSAVYALGWDDLWQNRGDGTFVDVATIVKFHMDEADNPAEPPWRDGGNTFAHACADYDNDGDLDVMTFETTHGDFPRSTADRSRILVNDSKHGRLAFHRPSLAALGLERDLLGERGERAEYGDEGDHGGTFFDFDNDGLLDLVIEASAYTASHGWLFHQRQDHTYEDVTSLAGIRADLWNSNGLSVADLDRDGALDIVTGSVAGKYPVPGVVEQVHVYRNALRSGNHWFELRLEGKQANRQGIGARVIVTAGCKTQVREIPGGKGTFGAADPAYAHFGLGSATVVDRLEIRWPTNPTKVQVLENLRADAFFVVREDDPTPSCQRP